MLSSRLYLQYILYIGLYTEVKSLTREKQTTAHSDSIGLVEAVSGFHSPTERKTLEIAA